MRGAITSALLLLGLACGEDATGSDGGRGASGDLDCMEGDVAISEAIHARWTDPNACATHADCLHASTDVECPDDGATRYGCPQVVHRDSANEFTALLEEVKADLCPRIDPGCFGGAGCVSDTPRCVEGVCMGLLEGDFDAGPADAGTTDGA